MAETSSSFADNIPSIDATKIARALSAASLIPFPLIPRNPDVERGMFLVIVNKVLAEAPDETTIPEMADLVKREIERRQAERERFAAARKKARWLGLDKMAEVINDGIGSQNTGEEGHAHG